MFSYSAFGLRIRSDFPLPEFLPADGPPDVTIRVDRTPAPVNLLEPPYHVDLGVRDATLAFRRVGVFRLYSGSDILVSLAPGAELSLARLYLVGKVMATLLYQRGLLVLHASAMEVDGRAVAFVGSSGFGKSSLAASLHARGFKVVADDIVALDVDSAVPRAIPAFPQLKVDPEMALSLGHGKGSLVFLHSAESKRGLRVTELFASTPLPLALIYLLGEDEAYSGSLRPQEVLIELVRHSFPARLLQSGGGPHLRQCARLAKQVPVFRFVRRPVRLPPVELANLVRRDLAAARDHSFQEGTCRAVGIAVRP
jgi:hypothetical protein